MLLLESKVKVSVHLSPKVLMLNSFSFLSSLFFSANIFLLMSIIEFAGVNILLYFFLFIILF